MKDIFMQKDGVNYLISFYPSSRAVFVGVNASVAFSNMGAQALIQNTMEPLNWKATKFGIEIFDNNNIKYVGIRYEFPRFVDAPSKIKNVFV